MTKFLSLPIWYCIKGNVAWFIVSKFVRWREELAMWWLSPPSIGSLSYISHVFVETSPRHACSMGPSFFCLFVFTIDPRQEGGERVSSRSCEGCGLHRQEILTIACCSSSVLLLVSGNLQGTTPGSLLAHRDKKYTPGNAILVPTLLFSLVLLPSSVHG